jgi:hypothetical protein
METQYLVRSTISPLILGSIGLALLGGVVYAYSQDLVRFGANNTQPQDQKTLSNDFEKVSTTSVKQESAATGTTKQNKKVQQVTRNTQKIARTIALSASTQVPAYELTRAEKVNFTWEFGRDYVDITVQVDNRCTGPTCPVPPINFIARDLKNTGSYDWLVGDWMIADRGFVHEMMPTIAYSVSVRDSVTKEVLGNAKIALSSEHYGGGYLTVTNPSVYGLTLKRDSAYTIRWSTWPLKEFSGVKISVKNPVECPPESNEREFDPTRPTQYPIGGCVGTGAVYVLANDVPNTGAYTWKVGASADGTHIPSGLYKMVIEVPNQAFDESDSSFTLQ